MQHPSRRLIVSLLFVLAATSCPWDVWAQPPPAPARIAIVDIAKINADFSVLARKREEMQQWFQQQQTYLEELDTKYAYLSEQHFNEVLDILRMPRALPAAAAKRQKELRDLNDTKEARALELQAKTDRSPKEQDEFNQLQESYAARQKQIDGIKEGLQGQLTKMQADAQTEVIASMEQAVKDVATAGGYTLVVNRAIVLFGGEDITDAVLQKLNAGAPPKPAPAGPKPPPAGGGQ